jgi:trk system potassium uptake protein TrkH
MKILVRYLGYLLIISAFFRVVPMVTGWIYGEPVIGFILTALLSLALGGIMVLAGWPKPDDKHKDLNLTTGLMLAAFSFILLPLIGAITFLPSFNYNVLNAVFESISGFTTTGLTMYESLDSLPQSLLMWRAMTQWIGGIGIIMVFLFIFSRMQAHDYNSLAEAETGASSTVALYKSQGLEEKLEGGLRKSVTNIMIIYLGYTILGIVLLASFGLPLFEAIAMSFTALSTGGFSVTDTFYDGSWQLGILSILMVLGSISFVTHNKLLERQWKKYISDFEKNFFFLILIFFTLIALVAITDLKVILFEIISALTTTGFSISYIPGLPQLFILILMLSMVIGGGLGSTSGGIKLFRVYYLLKAIPWSIRRLMSPPNAVIPLMIHEKKVDKEKLINISVFVFTYFLILLLGTIIFMLFGHSFLQASFQIISALGTVGTATMPLYDIHPLLKSVLIIAMLFGRLEIFPILILIRKLFR